MTMPRDAGATPRQSAEWPRIVIVLLLFTQGVVFSLLMPVNKIAIESGLPTIAYVFWWSLGAGLFLLIGGALSGRLPGLGPAHLRTYAVSGALGVAAPMIVLTYVAPKLPVGIVTLILITVPLFTYLFASLAGLDKLRGLSAAGLLLGLAGVLVVMVPTVSLPSREMVGWVLLALLAPLSFSVVNIFVAKYRPPAAPSLGLAAGLMLASAILLAPVMLATGQLYVFPGPRLAGDLAILGAVAINAYVYLMFFEIVRRAGPVFFSQMNYIVVLAGFGWGILLFGESHSAYIWGAAALMLLGFALLNFGTLKTQRERAVREAPR